MKSHFTFFKKAAAVFLASLFFCLAGLSFIGIFFAAEYDFYTSTLSQLHHDAIKTLLASESDQAFYRYSSGGDPVGYYESTNFCFEIKEIDGTLLLSNYNGEEIKESVTISRTANLIPEDIQNEESDTKNEAPQTLIVTGYMILQGTNLFKTEIGFINFLFNMRFILIGILALSLLFLLILSVYLIYAAGHRPGEEKPRASLIEKIPFDLFIAIYVGIAIFGILMLDLIQYSVSDLIFFMAAFIAVEAAYLLLLAFGMSFSVRIKTKTIWKNTLIYIIFSFLGRKIRALFRLIPLVWKTAIFIAVYFLLDFIGFVIFWNAFFVFVLVKNILCLPIVLYVAYSFRKLQKGAEEIEKGGLDKRIDTENMLFDFKNFGKTLNHIGDGLNKAVDERIKSERMKTELITNVSHDIKTPLTSIINYADLLKKEKLDNETAVEYIEVIDRQASRLKKLITDLVEASKASTGNIQVNLEKCDIAVLVQQAVGEYDEKFKNAGLTPILRLPEEPLCISADGRLLWRVFDNLLSNICKYSLPGTRVYLNSAAYGNMCIISFKNISRTELNIPPDELVERFVRADSSRSTEGNGLGLSIAHSLIELQGGKIEIVADGDLFKVNIQFPILSEQEEHS